MTSVDATPGSLTVFQSSRLARPQDASKAPNLVIAEQLARSHFDVQTWLELANRYVDPVFQHSWRHYVGFIRNLVKDGSVRFVEDAVEHVGLFFVAKEAGAQRFVCDARANNRHFLRPPSWPLLASEGLCHVESQGAHEDAQNWFVGSADINHAFHQMRIP